VRRIDELQGLAHNHYKRDLHAGRRQHENHDYDYHEDRGRVSGREEKLASLITADSGKGSVTAPLCCMSKLNLDVIDEENALTEIARTGHRYTRIERVTGGAAFSYPPNLADA